MSDKERIIIVKGDFLHDNSIKIIEINGQTLEVIKYILEQGKLTINYNNQIYSINTKMFPKKNIVIYKNFRYANQECKIFSKLFIKNNPNLKMKIKNKVYPLSETFPFSYEDELKIEIIGDIVNCRLMFEECINLHKFQLNTKNVNDMSYMFYGCKRLKDVSDIASWDTSNVVDMSYMFYGCKNIEKLPNIDNWMIENVKIMNNLFGNCTSLYEIPYISKWIFNKDVDIYHMFENCYKLRKSPISIDKLEKVGYKKEVFYLCMEMQDVPKEMISIEQEKYIFLKNKFYDPKKVNGQYPQEYCSNGYMYFDELKDSISYPIENENQSFVDELSQLSQNNEQNEITTCLYKCWEGDLKDKFNMNPRKN